MRRKLPPLNALRAFEAAARHLSFTLAAEELSVTQAAVSHQVKALEGYLGAQLFRRLSRGLLLTEEGQGLLPALSDGFDRLAEAASRVGRAQAEGRGVLNVTLLTTFALGWLVPRLSSFQMRYPAIETRLQTVTRVVDFAREDVDCGIRNGIGPWPGLSRWRLWEEHFTPLCAPELAARLKTPTDLEKVTLFQTIGLPNEWQLWADGAGIDAVVTRGPQFDSTYIAVQAALRGTGVAVADPRFYTAEIMAGRLVLPFPALVPIGKSWWFICLENLAERPKIKLFRDWILTEAEQFLGEYPNPPQVSAWIK